MFPKHKITAVNQSGIKTTKHLVQANLSTGQFSTNTSVASYINSQYNFFMSGLIPATPDISDTTSLAYFYRDLYLHDNIAGSCVDIQSVFPFSDWELRGLDEKDLSVFNRALSRLNLREFLPQMSVSYLTDGFSCSSLIYDSNAKNFMDLLIHDAMTCGITPSPFNNIDPTIRVNAGAAISQFMDSSEDYAKLYLSTMPKSMLDLLRQGSFILDPVTSLFIGRRGLTDRAYQSYLHRILPMYLIEKSMYRGTLIESNRRQRAMTHITAGDDLWTPTSEELVMIVKQFQDAEQDPLGGWISTRNAVQTQDVRPGGDFWKYTDMVDTMTSYKLRALGISEALLSGDASYASAESAYSTFLETVDAYRTHITHSIFYKKLFPLIAVSNGMYKDVKRSRDNENVVDFLFNSNNRELLKLPLLHWHKNLTAKTEDNMMDMLEKVKETTNINIPLKTWLAAAGVDKETLMRDKKEDDELRKMFGNAEDDGGMIDNEEGDNGDELPVDDDRAEASMFNLPTSINSPFKKRRALLSRKFEDGDVIQTTPTGKRKMVLNSDSKMKDIHHRIAKIAAKVESDPNYRQQLKQRNLEKLGSATLKGFV